MSERERRMEECLKSIHSQLVAAEQSALDIAAILERVPKSCWGDTTPTAMRMNAHRVKIQRQEIERALAHEREYDLEPALESKQIAAP